MNEENNIVEEQEVYVPSPKWKRIIAWILFAIFCVGIVFWLLGIAYPNWIDSAREWLGLKS